METIVDTPLNPAHWKPEVLQLIGTDAVHTLAERAAGTLASYRLILGRCLLTLQESKGYREFGCSRTTNYATAILGMDIREARECLRVARALVDLPLLTIEAEAGHIEWSKLREIARVAGPATELLWVKLSRDCDYKPIEKLVGVTPKGEIPGEVDHLDTCRTTELRCRVKPRIFKMLQQARRLHALEHGEVVSNADILEKALVSYITGQPATPEALEKLREEADKDLQAERARELPEVQKARELARDLGLLEGDSATRAGREETDEEYLAQALGGYVQHLQDEPDWQNHRLSFNPDARHTTKGQKIEILRRDGWKCRTPGCQNTAWLEIHHVVPYSKGGKTIPSGLICLCSGCHRNHHDGYLQIQMESGELVFRDKYGRRLDRQTDIELAAWLDYHLGYSGSVINSYQMRCHNGDWAVFER